MADDFMGEKVTISFRAESSLLTVLEEGVQNQKELRAIISSLVLGEPDELVQSDRKLLAIYTMANMILTYENFCDGGPDGIL